MCVFFFFFFKQKTAYEMRISDWSSDVCSSDLGEANIPVVGPAQQLALVNRLTVTAALRYEDYPGMGRVTTPKLGLVYEPVRNIAIKASWGRSFKAPTMYQQYVGYAT